MAVDDLEQQKPLSILEAGSHIARLRSQEKGKGKERISVRTQFAMQLLLSGDFKRWKAEDNERIEREVKAGKEWERNERRTGRELVKAELDSIGIWLRVGPEEPRGVRCHIPFEEMTLDFIDALRPLEIIRANDLEEIELRVAEKVIASSDAKGESRDTAVLARMHTIINAQENEIINTIVERFGREIDKDTPERRRRGLFIALYQLTHELGNYSSFPHFPRVALQEYLKDYIPVSTSKDAMEDLAHKAMTLMWIAEEHQKGVTRERDVVDDIKYKIKNWRKIAFINQSKIAKDLVESRSSTTHDPLLYESNKFVEALLETFTPEQLQGAGATMVFAPIADGRELVGLWTLDGYYGYGRVLIDPSKAFRSDAAKATHDSIVKPLRDSAQKIVKGKFEENDFCITRSEFERLDALLLPYRVSERLGKSAAFLALYVPRDRADANWDKNWNELHETMDGLLRVLVTEIAPTEYQKLLDSWRALERRVGAGEHTEQESEIFSTTVEKILENYRAHFKGKKPREILEMRLSRLNLPKEPLRLDAAFSALVPESIKKNKHWNEELSKSGAEMRVAYSGSLEYGLSYVQEGPVLNALKIDTERPVILTMGGAKNLSIDGDVSQVDAMSRIIAEISAEFTTNTIGPGTQSGLGVSLSKALHEKRLESGDSEARPNYVAIEPGKSTFVPGNPHMHGLSDEELASMWVGVPGYLILTPYEAGWSEGQTMYSYQAHVDGRQGLVTRLSDGKPRVSVVGNGGKWTLQELVASMKDGFPAILVSDTGRLAALASMVIEKRAEWEALSGSARAAFVEQLIDSLSWTTGEKLKIAEEFKQIDYREAFLQFMNLSLSGHVRSVPVSGLKEALRETITTQTEQLASQKASQSTA